MPSNTFNIADPYSTEALEIQRRRQLAETLASQNSSLDGPTEMAGGWAVKKSPYAGLADILRKYTAGAERKKADADLKELGEKYRGDRTSDMTMLAQMLKGSPASSEQIVDEQAAGGEGAPATITAPGRAGGVDPAMLGQLRTPQMQDMGMGMWAKQMALEEARKDAALKEAALDRRHLTPSGGDVLKERGAGERHLTPSGSAVLGEQGSQLRHSTPSGGAILADQRVRSEGALGRGNSMAIAQMGDTRAREAAERDKFGQPFEGTGPDGKPGMFKQNKTTGEVVPVTGVGPKIGEPAQKQQTGVANTQAAISEYRNALKNLSAAEIASPNARARMGTIYNNMLLQAKEAYNLGVLNGPDYMILQEVITNPVSMKGGITSKKALDDQAAKLDEIMGKIGSQITQTQTGRTPNGRATDDPLGLRPKPK